jgi:hypothetical protein
VAPAHLLPVPKRVLICLLSVCLALMGCTTTSRVPLAQPADEVAPSVFVGDRVIVTMKSGQIRHLKVEAVDAQTLTGRNMEGPQRGSSRQLSLAEVEQIQVHSARSGRRTAVLIAGALASVVVASILGCLSRDVNFCLFGD